MDVSGRLSGSNGSLTKAGTGTLVYSANNTYSGATLVSAGTLLVNGSLAAGSALTVESGATLGGNGTINGAATVNGNLAPGNSPGVLKFANNLTLGPTASVAMELNGTTRGTGYDGVDVSGALAYGGAMSINVGSQFLTPGQTLLLIAANGTVSGNFTAVQLAGAYGSGFFTRSGGVWTFTDSMSNTWSFNQGDGILSLSTGPANPYDAWAEDYGLDPSTNGAPTADPDGDSFSNMQEYAFGTSPVQSTASLQSLSSSGGDFILSWLERDNLVYAVQTTTNLAAIPFANDSSISVQAGSDTPNPPQGYTRKQFSVPASGIKFFRIRATSPE
jgi:autotransporter-associated beta strand protein